MPLNVLVIDRAPPTDLRQGNALIAANVFPRMRDARLTLVTPVVGDVGEVREELDGIYEAIHLVPRRRQVDALIGGIEPALARWTTRSIGPLGRRMDLAGTRELDATIAHVLASSAFDAVHVRQLPMAAHIGRAPVGRLLELIDSEALATRRASGRRSAIRGVLARRLEAAAVDTADIVTTVSPVDAAAVEALRPGTRVEVVANGVATDVFDPDAVPPQDVEPDTVAFTGAMSFAPNIEAAAWLVGEVLPILRRERPGVRVRLIGRDPTAAVRALATADVEVTGTVPDVRPEILRSAVVAVPMVSGSGIKNKLLEAMALGRPVVSTTMGVESIDVVHDRDLLVADGASAFAAAIGRLLASEPDRSRLGAAARAFVVDGYSWDATAARFRELYEELAVLTRRRSSTGSR